MNACVVCEQRDLEQDPDPAALSERFSIEAADRRVDEVFDSVGLSEFADRMPTELSGGQRKRVSIARAIAARSELLLYDEPTTGLDPITATTIDDEIMKRRDIASVSSIIVTHQLRDAFYVATHEAVLRNDQITIVAATPEKVTETEFLMLRNGRMAFEGDAEALRASRDQYITTFLS